MRTVEFRVEQEGDDPRLDKVISLHRPEISRNLARKVIETGGAYVNQKRCKKNAKTVALGDKIRLVIDDNPPPEQFEFTKERVVFENQDWIVVDKPPYLPTHETIDNTRHHLAIALQTFLAKREGNGKAPKQVYLGIHHRLDRDTTGLILFTKRKEANHAVAMAFQDRTVQKTYLALSKGKLPAPRTITSFLGPSPRNKRLQASIKRGGKFAETEIRAVEAKQGLTLVEAKPKTGRTHQIRVHLSENGLPILGDEAYGVAHPNAPRVMLHAWRLELLGHTFSAPLPRDFRDLDFAEPQD